MKRIKLICLTILCVLIIIVLLLSTYKIIISPTKQKEFMKDESIRDIMNEKIVQENDKSLEENSGIIEIEKVDGDNSIHMIELGSTENISTLKSNTSSYINEEIVIEPRIDENTNTKYITYEDIGIMNEQEDSYQIIRKTHEIANENGYEVRATLSEYHIYKLEETKPIQIKTSTNWNGAKFIIHDEKIESSITRDYSIFQITSNEREFNITNSEILNRIKINKQTKQIEQLSGYGKCLCIVYNSNKKQYIRSGSNSNLGNEQLDIFRIDNDGNVLNEIQWEFEDITRIRIIPIPKEQIIIQNGNFQTNLDENEQSSKYLNRNITCNRSNTVLKNINHTLDDENKISSAYFGFIKISCSAEVEIIGCKLVAHRYKSISSYDLILEYATNILLDRVTSDYIEENDRWGITGTNYTKDITYKNCILNRIDAHCGVHNLTIDNCMIGVKGITLNGSGDLKISNTTKIGGNAFIELRPDYGSTWDGDIRLQKCEYNNISKSKKIIDFRTAYTTDGELHDYGYSKVLPNIYINDLQIKDKNVTDEKIYIFYNDSICTGNEKGNLMQAGYILPKEIIVDNYNVSAQKSIKAFYQDFEGLSNINIKIDIPNRPKLEMKTENNIEYINGELTNQNIHLKLETKDKIQNEMQINGQAIEEKEVILKETGNYQIIVTSIDSAGNTIQDQYEVKIDKKEPKINGIEENKIYEQGVTPIIEDENLDLVTLYYNENVVKDYKINTQLTKEGKYKIEATDKAGNKKIVSFEIQSPEKIENIKQYRVKETYITEILPTTTRQEFFKNASLNSKLKIYHEGKEITDVEIIKTGDILRINNQDYTLIVKADPSGDGKTSILDLMKVKRHIIGTNHLSEAALLAADLNEDGKVNIMDAMNFVRILTK